MAMTQPLQGFQSSIQAPTPGRSQAVGGALSAGAMARILGIALLWGAASVPAFMAGMDVAGWCLALMSVALVSRFPMAGFCAQMGGGAYVGLTLVAVLSPVTLGTSGLFEEDPWMSACAWLTLGASVASLVLLNVPTFNQAFRNEGHPVATWKSLVDRKS